MQKVVVQCFVESHYPLATQKLKNAVTAAILAGPSKADALVNISVIGDRKMRELNRTYRGQDKTTNVLAFPYSENLTPDEIKFKETHLGEIVLSYPQVVKRAMENDELVEEAAQFLVVHGALHLLGYDHEKPEEAYQMEKLEDQIMQKLDMEVIT